MKTKAEFEAALRKAGITWRTEPVFCGFHGERLIVDWADRKKAEAATGELWTWQKDRRTASIVFFN